MPDHASPALEVQALRRAYGELEALRSLTLKVYPGECVALIGSNGSGKSTTMRTIAGLLEPTSGTVSICGFDPHVEPEGEQARALCAFVPDSPLLYDDLTVREHLELVAVSHGIAGPETDQRIDEMLERLTLSARSRFRPPQLSRGMRQKTQLACALIRPTDLLLLDEPVVGLDPPSQALLQKVLEEAKAGGTAVVLTTHQLGFARGLADDALLLEEGVVADRGPFEEVADRASADGWTTL